MKPDAHRETVRCASEKTYSREPLSFDAHRLYSFLYINSFAPVNKARFVRVSFHKLQYKPLTNILTLLSIYWTPSRKDRHASCWS